MPWTRSTGSVTAAQVRGRGPDGPRWVGPTRAGQTASMHHRRGNPTSPSVPGRRRRPVRALAALLGALALAVLLAPPAGAVGGGGVTPLGGAPAHGDLRGVEL